MSGAYTVTLTLKQLLAARAACSVEAVDYRRLADSAHDRTYWADKASELDGVIAALDNAALDHSTKAAS